MTTSAQNRTRFAAVTERPFLDDFDADDAIEWEDARDAAEYRDGFITIGDLEDWESELDYDNFDDEYSENDDDRYDYD